MCAAVLVLPRLPPTPAARANDQVVTASRREGEAGGGRVVSSQPTVAVTPHSAAPTPTRRDAPRSVSSPAASPHLLPRPAIAI